MHNSRTLMVKKPVKLIFAGGFLGSGKTTALAALATTGFLWTAVQSV